MKVIGILGGLSWVSTREYYTILNEGAHKKLGKNHSAKVIIYSLDFEEVEALVDKRDYHGLGAFFVQGVKKLEAAGAECLILGSNTAYTFAEVIQSATSMSLIDIIDPTAARIKERGISKVGLLATKFTMEQPGFYKDRMKEKHGIDVIVPESEEDRAYIHRVIFEELFWDIKADASRRKFLSIMDSLVVRGAEGIILGCTEIPLLIRQTDTPIPVFDTTEIHAMAALDFALQG